MKVIQGIELKSNSQEELLVDLSSEFPHIASHIHLDQYIGQQCPWHFHNEIELFYVEQGTFEYRTPHLTLLFPPGSIGIINAKILHMAKVSGIATATTALLHLFDPAIISGQRGSLIDQKFVVPIISNPCLEMMGIYPEDVTYEPILSLMKQSFHITENDYTYEMQLRNILSTIWMLIFKDIQTSIGNKKNHKVNETIKIMLDYIHQNFTQKITVSQIAASAFISERKCYRLFHNHLHLTPMQYLLDYKLQVACRLLATSDDSITEISFFCGFETSSYFGKIFREFSGDTPINYRKKWQNRNI